MFFIYGRRNVNGPYNSWLANSYVFDPIVMYYIYRQNFISFSSGVREDQTLNYEL